MIEGVWSLVKVRIRTKFQKNRVLDVIVPSLG